jgi:hypothetical protein
MPEIIRFSNDLCYHDTPLLPLREYPPQRLEPIMVRHVVDGYREGGANRVINRPEAAALVKTVIDCLNDPRYAGKSMGVICLQGQAQAQLIEQMLLDAVGPEPFEERHLICGDPYSFQGDERDVVFLSMLAASEGDGRSAALVRESYRQRFNVAVSRAKDQLWLFHSIAAHELHPDCMRRRLLEYCYHPPTQSLPQDLSLCESEFEREVATELANAGYRVIPQYPAAGKRIDLVVEGTKVPDASDENDRIIRDVVGFGYVMWMRLSRWGKENETLNRRERKFVYDVGRHIRQEWPLTIRQARWAAMILEEAIQNGFDMNDPD